MATFSIAEPKLVQPVMAQPEEILRKLLSQTEVAYPASYYERADQLNMTMDQVITLISQMYSPLYGEDPGKYLSASMINNYVKSKLIPRPVGKKYSREQIALLAMIVVLKQVASMEDIRKMLTPKEGQSVEQLYTAFCNRFHQVIMSLHTLCETGSQIPASLEYAILSSGVHAGCMAVLKAEADK